MGRYAGAAGVWWMEIEGAAICIFIGLLILNESKGVVTYI